MDDEWDGASSAERSIAQKNRRKKVEESMIAERIAANSVATPVSRRTPSQMAAARVGNRGQPPKAPPFSSTTPPGGQTTQVSDMTEEKKKQIFDQNLQSTLLKHKEQLKRDISKKRSMQEKELTLDIKRDIEKIKESVTKTVTLRASSPPPVPVSVQYL